MTLFCRHVYENVEDNPCPDCGNETHAINWVAVNAAHEAWLKNNPDSGERVWWSI